jgi:adenine phosphoribosyltransferase
MKLELLKKSLVEAPIVKKGDYYYVVHPITDGVPEIKPDLLIEVKNGMKKIIEKYGKFDKIVTIEAMGIPLASSLSLAMNIPFIIIRKRQYGLPGEISVKQITGYSKTNLFINGLKRGDKIVIVDDVLSTGGTIRAVLSVLINMGVLIKGVIIAVDKGNVARIIEKEFGIDIISLINIDISNGKVILLDK